MPRLTRRLPRYCHHKATGRAVVYLGGKPNYLGRYGTPESKAQYKAVVARWLEGRALPSDRVDVSDVFAPQKSMSVAELILRYKRHSEAYYRDSREASNLKDAIRPVRVEFGKLAASLFGPLHLKRVRDLMIEAGLSRRSINSRVNRIRRMFKWAVAEEIVGPEVLAKLQAVEPLRPGRGGKERPPVRPVTWEAVEATLPHLSLRVRAMVLFAWHTGARPGELVQLTTASIDRTKDVWGARLEKHKNAYRGHSREILIGPKAQEILSPWLRPERPDDPIFAPTPEEGRGRRRKRRRKAPLTYSRCGFAQAVRRGCDRAGIPPWSPNTLRHAAATRLREEFGIEAAQIALGHARPDTTLIYTGAARSRAVAAVLQAG